MRNPLSQKITGIQPSGIRKFFDIVSEMPDAISLGVGEPDFDTPWNVREEGIYALEKGRTFYTSNAGLKELREEICNYLARKMNLHYDPMKEVLITVGGSEAIDVALRCMCDPGDEVLIPQPSYVSYLPCAIMADAKPVIIELKEENEFKLTKEELLASITDKTKVLVMPFPNNPTGAVMTREELEELVPVIIEKDIYVISDEIYSALTYNGEHCSIGSLPGMKERTIVINGFSKAFAMTGWRLGYACGPKEIISQMTKLHQFAIMCAPTNSQFAAIEALKNCDMEVNKMVEAYDQRRRYLMHAFKEMGLDCFEPFGAFYVFPSIKKFGLSSEEFANRLLREQKLAVVPGLRAGLGMVNGITTLVPSAKIGHIGLYRDPVTHEPHEYYCKLPDPIDQRLIVMVDPMLATGGSAIAAVNFIKEHGGKSIKCMFVIAAPEGLKRLHEVHPDVQIYVGHLDRELNERAYICPGLGDAGDRIFGTK